MRMNRNLRPLAAKETEIAKSVFKSTLPYDDILVGDGLGYDDRPYTLPQRVIKPSSLIWGVVGAYWSGDDKYIMFVGDGYYGMSHLDEDKKLLIHELTHVWQGHNSSWKWSYVFSSAWHQATEDDAYDYGKADMLASGTKKAWSDYNPEQQANIVEDWYADGRKGEGEKANEYDPRYEFIVRNIRKEQMPAPPKVARSRYTKVTIYIIIEPAFDEYITPILEKRFNENDTVGPGERVKKLEFIFQSLVAQRAKELLARLNRQDPKDKLSTYFRGHLHSASQRRLLEILKKRAAAAW